MTPDHNRLWWTLGREVWQVHNWELWGGACALRGSDTFAIRPRPYCAALPDTLVAAANEVAPGRRLRPHVDGLTAKMAALVRGLQGAPQLQSPETGRTPR